MKELKDYLPFYLGIDCQLFWRYEDGTLEFERVGTLIGIKPETKEQYGLQFKCKTENGNFIEYNYPYSDVKPILRTLSDITEEEAIQVAKLKGMLTASNGRMICNNERLAPDVFLFLLSKQIDLFDLIEAGLAIDATTLKQTEHAK